MAAKTTNAPWIDMTPTVRRRTISAGEKMMQMLVELKGGSHLPEHHHVHEQIIHVVRGRLKVTLGGGRSVQEIPAGSSLYLASDRPHAVDALDDSVVVDTFSPPREDLLEQDRKAMK
jgi:quercetin dioxygenase-like cupin family protein